MGSIWSTLRSSIRLNRPKHSSLAVIIPGRAQIQFESQNPGKNWSDYQDIYSQAAQQAHPKIKAEKEFTEFVTSEAATQAAKIRSRLKEAKAIDRSGQSAGSQVVGDELATAEARTPKDEDFAKAFKEKYGTDPSPEVMNYWKQAAKNEVDISIAKGKIPALDKARKELEDQEESQGHFVARKMLGSDVFNSIKYGRAVNRVKEGNPEPGDYSLLSTNDSRNWMPRRARR